MRLRWFCLVVILTTAGSLAQAAPGATSKVWPMCDEGAAWFIENLPNVETLGFMVGPEVKQAPDALYPVVEVPAYVELIATVANYSQPAPPAALTDVTRDGRAYRRYVLGPARKDTERWARLFAQFVPHPTAADRNDPGKFIWHFETPDGPEPEQALPIKLLPELPAVRPPKRMLVHFYNSPNCNIPPDKLGRVLELLSRAGVNLLGSWEARVEALKAAGCTEKGIRLHHNMGGQCGWHDMEKPSPAPRYQNADQEGKPVPEQDPQWVLDEQGKPWADDLARCRNLARVVDAVTQDIEWQAIYTTGFSPAGVEAFARRFSLDAAKLTPQIIRKQYRRQWGDFRAEQYFALARLYTQAAREANPKSFTLWNPGAPYSTTDPDLMSNMIELGPDALGRTTYLMFPFATDRIQDCLDVLEPMWYGHGVSQVREAFAWTRAITKRVKVKFAPLYLGQGREFYYPGGDPGEVLRAMNWAALLGGAKGYGYWQSEFSPLQYSWLARNNREVSQLEDLLLDGKPDPAGIALTPMPKRRFTLVSGSEKRSFPVPDFGQAALWRAYGEGDRRLVGVINLDQGLEVYYKLAVSGLPEGRYHIFDVAENQLLCRDGKTAAFSASDLAQGLVLRTAAKYGVSLYLIQPEREPVPAGAGKRLVPDIAAAYEKYREPDTTGAVLAERAGLTIRYDMVGREGATAILIESPQQQVWVRPQDGGRISDWKIKEGNRTLVTWVPPYGGAAADLFWTPSDAHWSGDEISAYELVDAKIHGGKAYLRLRQKKQTPSLQGLIVTKTIAVPADRTDIEVKVEIENPGPTPEVGIAPWAHHVFTFGLEELAKSQPRQYPQVFLKTTTGVTEAPLKEIVWAKPGQGYLPGNESWEKSQRNGETTGDWIAERNPVTGEAVLCQVDGPAVAQFYSWRDNVKPDDLSLEWMYPYVKLAAGQTWQTGYVIRYLKSVTPQDLERRLLAPAPA